MQSLNPQIQCIKSVESQQQQSCLFCCQKQQCEDPKKQNKSMEKNIQCLILQEKKKPQQKINLFLKLNVAIGKKYRTNSEYYYTNLMNCILDQKEQEKHEYCSHPCLINYKQAIMIAFNDQQQEMKKQIRQYSNQSILQHLIERGQFYKFHLEVPRIHTIKIEQIMAKHYDKKRTYDYRKAKDYLNRQKGISICSLSQNSFNGDQQKDDKQHSCEQIDNSNFLEKLNQDTNKKNTKKKLKKYNKTKAKPKSPHIIKPKKLYQVNTVNTSDSILLKGICQQIENNQRLKNVKNQWSIDQGNYYLNPQHFQKYLMRQQIKQKNKKLRNCKNRKLRIYRMIVQRNNPYNYNLMLELKTVKRIKNKVKFPNKFRFNNVQIFDKQVNTIIKQAIQSQQQKRQIRISPYEENIVIIPGQRIFASTSQSARASNFRIKQNAARKQEINTLRPFSSNINWKMKEKADQNYLSSKQFKRALSTGKHLPMASKNILSKHVLTSEGKSSKDPYYSFKQFLASQKKQLQAKKLELQTNNSSLKIHVLDERTVEKNVGLNLIKFKSSSMQRINPKASKINRIKKSYIQQIMDRKLTIYDR